MSEIINTEAFGRPLGGDMVGFVTNAMEAQWKASTPRSVYELVAAQGMSARLIKQDDPRRPIGDELIVRMSQGNVSRTVTANIETQSSTQPALNLTEED